MKKEWKLHTLEGKRVSFTPVFEVIQRPGEALEDVECRVVELKIDGKKHTFNFINLYQFIYFIASEELRRGLMLRYQRRVNKIPYEVVFGLSEEEIKEKKARRRIELPVDELTMAVARSEASKLMPGVKNKMLHGGKPWELFDKRSRKR